MIFCRARHNIQHNQLGSSPAVGSHTDGSTNFTKQFSSYENDMICVKNLRHYNIRCAFIRLG